MVSDAFTEEELHAWVEGRLDAARAREVEAWLDANPAEAARWRAYGTQGDLLHAIYDPVLSEPVPARLRVESVRAGRGRRWPARAAAAVMLLAVGVAAGWFGRGLSGSDAARVASLADDAVVAHEVYVTEVRHPVEVAADQEAHLVKWLSKRLGRQIKAPHLGAAGFQLIGGRLLPSMSGPAAQFMYEDANGRRLTVYVRMSGKLHDTAFRFIEEKGVSAFYWVDEGFGCVLIGNIGRDRLREIANVVYRQLVQT